MGLLKSRQPLKNQPETCKIWVSELHGQRRRGGKVQALKRNSMYFSLADIKKLNNPTTVSA